MNSSFWCDELEVRAIRAPDSGEAAAVPALPPHHQCLRGRPDEGLEEDIVGSRAACIGSEAACAGQTTHFFTKS